MNNKLKKILSLFVLIIVTFFIFNDSLIAATAQIRYVKPTSAKNFPNLSYTLKSGSKTISTKNIQQFAFMYKDTASQQVYCVEPDAQLINSGTHNTGSLADYNGKYINTADKKTLLQYVLTFAPKLANVTTKVSLADTSKVLAAQALIWQIGVGEVKFNTNKTKLSLSGDFYNKIKSNTNSDVKKIYSEYNTIVTSVNETFLSAPTGFGTASKCDTVALSYDSKTGSFTKTINSTKFQYYDVSTSQNGLTISKTKNSITISSKAPINQTNAKSVKISVHNKNKGTAQAFYHTSQQDVVSIVGTTLDRYIKVYTPKYQLKITKTASLDGKKLSGVKFNVYNDNKCTTLLGTITTDKNGEATYQNIPAPGTYCLKEVKSSTPAGYEENSESISIKVNDSDIAGSKSYAAKTITNKNKEFNLTKKTIDENGKVVTLNDGCGTNNYTGPEFEIKEGTNNLYFKEIKPGYYDISSKDTEGATTKLKTCNGEFKVYTLPNCNYTISETKAPEGLTLPSEPTKSVNVCGADKNVSFTNGFAGLEFQKKDEDGNFVEGGKFSLQKNINNIYRDILLKQVKEGYYIYDANLKESDKDATYLILTDQGMAHITKLPPGEYRIVEKEAPEGFELIQDKDSKAIVTIKDSDKNGYYIVEMIDQKVKKNGSDSSAELVVTITTGRKVPNYIFIISALLVTLIVVIILRKRVKK